MLIFLLKIKCSTSIKGHFQPSCKSFTHLKIVIVFIIQSHEKESTFSLYVSRRNKNNNLVLEYILR